MKLLCPICDKALKHIDNRYVCPQGHSFDVSRRGYVNLLAVQNKGSHDPGDNKEMIASRRTMMKSGYYDGLAKAIVELISKYPHSKILDLGCGEGFITRKLAAFADEVIGIDISKHAIDAASSEDKKSLYVVASCNKLPVESNSQDLVVNCFAPMKESEVLRVLKKQGLLLKVTPAPLHLMELKQAIYSSVYPNAIDDIPTGFLLAYEQTVEYSITLKDESLMSLLRMTPYFYKTPRSELDRVEGETITTTLSFHLRLLKKA